MNVGCIYWARICNIASIVFYGVVLKWLLYQGKTSPLFPHTVLRNTVVLHAGPLKAQQHCVVSTFASEGMWGVDVLAKKNTRLLIYLLNSQIWSLIH